MKRKALIIAAAAVLLAAAVFTVFAVSRPAKSEGGYERDIIDRVRFSVDNTQFSLLKPETENTLCELEFTLRAEKTEADFYAVLHSAEFEGLDYETVVFQTAAGDNYVPQEMPLPAENGKTVPVEWTVRVRFPAGEADGIGFSLVLNYTSGITQETAEEHILKIPMQITFE